MNSFEDDDWSSLDGHGLIGALMGGEVVGGNLDVVAFDELLDLLEGEVKVESARVIKVVVRSVVMLIRSSDEHLGLETLSYLIESVLTRDLDRNCRETSLKCFLA